MGKTLKEILLQLIPVAVGVYIGILAGNWNEQRGHQENQKIFLENVAKELASNKEKMVSAHAYHEKIGKNLDSLIQHLENTNPEILNKSLLGEGGFKLIPGWYGVVIPGLESSIYQSGLISNAFSKMDFETITKISKAYSFQEEYKELTQPVIERLINTNPETTIMQAFSILTFITSDIKGLEAEMVRGYEEMIEFLEEKK